MVAVALGLLLLGSASTLVLGRLDDQRRQLLEARLGQELRAVADLITRDLRRAGHWGSADLALWSPDRPLPSPNPYAGLHPEATASAPVSAAAAGYGYSRDVVEDQLVSGPERFGLRLNANTQALELRLSGNGWAPGSGDQWQALTDPALLRVTAWQVQHRVHELALLDHCAVALCPAGATGCPPVWRQHLLQIELEARDARDASVRRRLDTRVSLRNGEVSGACPTP
jgi:type IV pilus assembly protein PilW